MVKMYTNLRRKPDADEELVSVTITLPKSELIELENRGVSSGRGGGNISIFLEIAALTVIGLFYNAALSAEQLKRLVRVDLSTPETLDALSDNLEATAARLRTE